MTNDQNQNWLEKWSGTALAVLFLLLLAASVYFEPILQNMLESYYTTEQSIKELRALIQDLGLTLIGISVIVTTLILFVMQVNIDKLPQDLFDHFGADKRLLSTSALSFFLAISLVALSMFTERDWLAFIVLSAIWAIIFIFVLFIYAYRRTYNLVNPRKQLDMLSAKVDKESKCWRPENDRAIRKAMLCAQHYAEKSDFQVFESALYNIAKMSEKYKTYIEEYPIEESHDIYIKKKGKFIGDNLSYCEAILQNRIARKNKQQVEQILNTLTNLAADISNLKESKAPKKSEAPERNYTHEAADQLTKSVRDAGRRMVGVVPKGLSLMEDLAECLISSDKFKAIREKAIREEGDDLKFKEIRKDISRIVKSHLKDSDVDRRDDERLASYCFPLKNILKNLDKKDGESEAIDEGRCKVLDEPPNDALSPLKNFVENLDKKDGESEAIDEGRRKVLDEPPNDAPSPLKNILENLDKKDGKSEAIKNIEVWANGISQEDGALLLEAIKEKSRFTNHIIRRIINVNQTLFAVSDAEACDSKTQMEIRKHARPLIAIFTQIQDGKDVNFIENDFKMTRILREGAENAEKEGYNKLATKICVNLLEWAFKVEKSGSLEKQISDYLDTILSETKEAILNKPKETILDKMKETISDDVEVTIGEMVNIIESYTSKPGFQQQFEKQQCLENIIKRLRLSGSKPDVMNGADS